MYDSDQISSIDRTSRGIVAISLVGYPIKAATSYLLASRLGAQHFDEYALAVSCVVVLSTACEAGLGKLGIKLISQARVDGKPEIVRGYLLFSLRLAMLLSIAAVTSVLTIELLGLDHIIWAGPAEAVLFLPFAALTGIFVEFCTAVDRPVAGALVARVLVPALPLGVITWSYLSATSLTSMQAILAYGGGWLVGAIVSAGILWRALLPAERAKGAIIKPERWLLQSGQFVIFSVLLSLAMEGSIVIFDLLSQSDIEISAFAVCVESSLLVLGVVKSLDKLYLSQLTAAVRREAWAEVRGLRRKRHRIVAAVMATYGAIIVLFGRDILQQLGAEYQGHYNALLLSTIGALALTGSSLSSWTLAYVERPAKMSLTLVASISLMVILMFALRDRDAAAGGAFAFASSCTLLAVVSEIRWATWFRRAVRGQRSIQSRR